MERYFEEIGEKRKIKAERKYFKFNPEIPLSKEYLSLLTKKDLTDYEMISIPKENHQGFQMGWHVDDCSTHKNSKKHQEKYNFPKYTLYSINPPPVYTAVLYYSTFNQDFRGGEFCFIDEEIKPQKYQGIFFNSQEVHQVKLITQGTRKCVLLKFYDKNHRD